MISDKYRIEMRCILPDSPKRYTQEVVEMAKERKTFLVLQRDLVIWRIESSPKNRKIRFKMNL